MTTPSVNMFITVAVSPIFECCCCTQTTGHQMLITTRPLYATVWTCPDCGHTVCEKHWMPCGRCYADCWEQHGGHWEDEETGSTPNSGGTT